MALPIDQQLVKAISSLKSLFGDLEPEAKMPEDATIESLWEEVVALRRELNQLKRVKRGVKPKVENAVKILITDPELAQLPIPIIAELIREVFKGFGIPCDCSESSVRWYMSQRSLEWNIVRRQMPPLPRSNGDADSEPG